MPLLLDDYGYDLPEHLIAQTPAEPRDASRLMVLRRADQTFESTYFNRIGRYLHPGDLLVANESRVLPARLFGRKPGGGRIEALLLRRIDDTHWETLMRGRGLRRGLTITFMTAQEHTELICGATIVEALERGRKILCFEQPIDPLLDQIGVMPLPPYIRQSIDPERYQTVYSHTPGSAAAPTAGLHFTEHLIAALQAVGIGWTTVTLHISRDTFQPIQEIDALCHTMHGEWFALRPETAALINATRQSGGRIVAVGTTSVRVLESAARAVSPDGVLTPMEGWTDIYIHPPYHFRVVDAMITNFHLPRSTPLLMTSAFAGRELLFSAYTQAISENYRLLSLGDAMLIL